MAGADTSYVFPKVIPSYIKATTAPSYVNVATEVILDFNSKNKQLFEIAVVNDAVELVMNYNLSPADLIAVGELFTLVTAKGLADSLSLADAATFGTGVTKVDSVSFADASTLSATKALADTAAINEAIALGNTKPFTDTATLTDTQVVQFVVGISNIIYATDGAMGGYGGALNAAALNVHSLLGTTGQRMVDEVTVTIT